MKLFLSLIFIGIGVTMLRFSNATNKHMICKTVDDVFNEENDVTGDVPVMSRRHHNGPPGKRGVKGEKGDNGQSGVKGEPGTPGVADYEKINATIKELISSVERTFTAKIESLEERLISKNNETIVPAKAGSCSGFVHNDQCFWAEIHLSEDINYAEAREICASDSGKPADITDAYQYNAVFNYIRSNMPSTKIYVNLWLAMTINRRSNRVKLSNGIQAPYVKYYPTHPKSDSSRTQMAIGIRRNAADRSQGMFDYQPGNNLMGVVCKK